MRLSAIETAENGEILNYMNCDVFQKCLKEYPELTGLPQHKECVRKRWIKLFDYTVISAANLILSELEV